MRSQGSRDESYYILCPSLPIYPSRELRDTTEFCTFVRRGSIPFDQPCLVALEFLSVILLAQRLPDYSAAGALTVTTEPAAHRTTCSARRRGKRLHQHDAVWALCAACYAVWQRTTGAGQVRSTYCVVLPNTHSTMRWWPKAPIKSRSYSRSVIYRTRSSWAFPT